MSRGLFDELRQLVRAPDKIFLIEHTFGKPPKETRHSIFERLAARAEESSLRIEGAPQRKKIVFIPTGAVEQEQCAARSPRHKLMYEAQHCLFAHDLVFVGRVMGARTPSICSRAFSIHGGSRRLWPSSSMLSSAVNPGGSVAISK